MIPFANDKKFFSSNYQTHMCAVKVKNAESGLVGLV